jgi:threonine/homoserine/homoserine lactone efflux protein
MYRQLAKQILLFAPLKSSQGAKSSLGSRALNNRTETGKHFAVDLPFVNGCIIGVSIAAPVGPIGVLCIRRSLANGARTGFFTGLGAAAADGFYGAVAAFGLTAVSGFLRDQVTALRVFGGIFLLYLGIKTFCAKPAAEAASAKTDTGAFTSTFFLTLTNPMTIFSFMAIFAGFGLASTAHNYTDATIMTAGVFVGSAAWWLFLSNTVALLRSRITPHWMQQVNRISGAIILAFAVAILWQVIRP